MLVQLLETGTLIASDSERYGDMYTDTSDYSLAPNTFTYGWVIDPQVSSWWFMWISNWKLSIEMKSIYDLQYKEIYEDELQYRNSFVVVEDLF